MAQTFFKPFVLICLLYIHLVPIEALKCYHCAFVEGILPNPGKIKGEPSCEPEKKPDPSLIVDCEDLEYIPGHEGGENLIIGHEFNNSTDKHSDGRWTFSCFTVNFNGKIKTGSDINFMLRSCLARPVESGSRLPEKCYSNSNSEIRKEMKEDEVNGLLAALQPNFSNNTQTKVCTCNGDNCNGYKEAPEKKVEMGHDGNGYKEVPGRKAEMGQDENSANTHPILSLFVFLASTLPSYFSLNHDKLY